MRLLIIILAILFSILILGLAGFGLYIDKYGLGTKVISVRDMKKDHVDTVRLICELAEDEKIIYFYSTDLFNPDSDGTVLTNKSIYSYVTYDFIEHSSPIVFSAPLSEVKDVTFVKGASFIDDTEITVTYGEDDETLMLTLPIEAGGDMKFINQIKSSIKIIQPEE